MVQFNKVYPPPIGCGFNKFGEAADKRYSLDSEQMYPRDITATDFIEHTSSAVASLFDAISKEEARYAPIKEALQGAHEMHYACFITSDLNEDFDDHQVQHKFAQAAEAKMQAFLVSQSIEVMCGAVLQIAKQGISLILEGNDRYTRGRNIGSQHLSNVIWHGRNQAMHWEEGAPANTYTQTCFKTLSSEFSSRFEIGEHSRNLAWDVCNVIGWSSYEEYEQDIRAILEK